MKKYYIYYAGKAKDLQDPKWMEEGIINAALLNAYTPQLAK